MSNVSVHHSVLMKISFRYPQVIEQDKSSAATQADSSPIPIGRSLLKPRPEYSSSHTEPSNGIQGVELTVGEGQGKETNDRKRPRLSDDLSDQRPVGSLERAIGFLSGSLQTSRHSIGNIQTIPELMPREGRGMG